MNNRNSSKGAISVFLAMILVPCIVVSCVFVDLSRVHMSKAQAESSADLALNALLTNYDADLSDWYGLVASCQTVEEFYTVSAEYFLRTISSQGLSDEEIVLLSDYYAAATSDDTIYDLLQIECQTDVSTIVSAVQGVSISDEFYDRKPADINLTYSSVLKDQIVEFMKYRGPIQIAEDIFGMLKNETGATSPEIAAVIESEENKKLVDDKQAFYQAEGELLTAAFYTYWAIRDYYDDAKALKYNNEKLEAYAEKINGYKTAYAYIHNAVVKYLCNTASLKKYERVEMSLDEYSYSASNSKIYSRKETKDGVTTYYINQSKINKLLNELDTAIDKFNTAIKNYGDATVQLMSKTLGDEDWEANPVQWWVQMNAATSSHHETVSKAADTMMDAYAKVAAILDCTFDGDVTTTWEDRFVNLTDEVERLQALYLTAGVEDASDKYLAAVNKLEEVSDENYTKTLTSGNGVYVTVDGKSMSVRDAITHIQKQLSDLKTELDARIKELEIAINGDMDEDDGKVKSLSELADLAEQYNLAFEQWSDTADSTYKPDGSYTDLAKADQKEIDDMPLQQEINRASVTELETRLKNIQSQLQALSNAIESMKYGNKKLTEIKTVIDLKNETIKKVSRDGIGLTNGELDKYAGETFGQLFKPTSSKVITLSNTTGNSHNPDINPEKDNTVDTPDLFVYLHDTFKNKSKAKLKKAEEDEDTANNNLNTYKEDQAKGLLRETYGTNIPKEYSNRKGFSAGTALLKTTISLFKDLLGDNLDNIRDDIYVTSYITNMFSYATFDYEAMYDMVKKEDRKNITPSNAWESYYKELEGAADKPGTWLSTDMTDSYNKSLTNKMINAENNAAYLSEIEYILYGKGTNVENVKAAFGDIYAFRFVLNTVSAFQHFWNDGTIRGVAISISGFTGGIIPPAVIKAVMLPILAAVETCMDNQRLAKGMPVELYKLDADDWWISVSPGAGNYTAFFDSLKENGNVVAGKNQDEGIFYSDYLTIFVYAGLSGGGAVEDDMYERMAEVIQANMRKLIGEGSTYSMAKCRVYFQLKTTIRVKPLMITMPIFNDYENNMDTATHWCTYEVDTVRGYS